MSALGSASREDLLTLIALLQDQNSHLRTRCDQLEVQVIALEGQNAALAAANERLTARVAELERRLGRNLRQLLPTAVL